MSTQQFGLIGLGVMGKNLILNVERNGFGVAVYNRTDSKTRDLVENEAKGKDIVGTYSVEEFTASLERPRRIMLLVKAGPAVDAVIEQLLPHLDEGDLIIDGGNSHFPDSERRAEDLKDKGINFLGMGVSGGEEGALWGPSLMPGGAEQAYRDVEHILKAIAADAEEDGEPCVAYIGPRGAGHFVKMVHNGIEYGDMQLIAESYDLLKTGLGLSASELSEIFEEWNTTELSSYLIEITAKVLAKVDHDTGKPLVDVILDAAGQKGTGKWTTQAAMDFGAPIPTITAAVDARFTSALKDERVAASKVLPGPEASYERDAKELIDATRDALYAAKICSYAQGMSMIRIASDERDYNLKPGEIAKIWRAGCIIRARLLHDISEAFERNAELPNLLVDDAFSKAIIDRLPAWRRVVTTGIELGVPMPAMSGSLAYYDAYRSERLPANLIQGQRDYFGAHTFQRVDKEGTFHVEWMEESE